MTEFNNPTFKKTFSSSGNQPLRQWTVPDGEQMPLTQDVRSDDFSPEVLADLEQSVRVARKEKISNETKITAPGKQRLEILANIGRLSKEVDVGGVKFSLRTLKTKETREVALAAFNPLFKTDLEASYEMRRQQLARSIFKIDGHDIALVLGSDNFTARLEWIDNDLEESVALKLFAEMQLLNEQAKTQFDIKTEEQAKEVAEDLKKITKEPDHRFIWFLCKTFGVMPDDQGIENMDPIMKAWMFYNWMEDYNDEFKLLENQAYLIGSFGNPEAVKKMLGHGAEQHKSSNAEFDQLSQELMKDPEEHLTRRQKRKRKIQK